MYKRISLAALAVFVTAATASTAMAADLAPPPPPAPAPQIRSSINDWTGPYLGGVIGGTCMETSSFHHNTVEDGTTVNDDDDFNDPGESWDGHSVLHQVRGPYDMNGCGLTGGVIGGFNYQIGNIVAGIEGDWTWGGQTGEHSDTNEHDSYDIDWMASIRPRAGILVNNDTLFYVTGGPAWMRGELGDDNTGASFKKTHFGYAIGGGIEHALTENIHIRGEYLFSAYKAKTYGPFCATCGTDGNPNTATVNVEQKMKQFHTFRLGVTWNMPISTW